MEAKADEDLFISTLALAELWQGILVKAEGRKRRDLLAWFKGPSGPGALFLGRILPLDEAAALQWAEFMAAGRRAGRPRSVIDMQIAAIAKVNGCAMVTRNTKDFLPVREEVELIDPTHA